MRRLRSKAAGFGVSFAVIAVFLILTDGITAARETESIRYKEFVLISPQETDDLSLLAARYLNDPEKGWLIANFNNLYQSLQKKVVVIPLRPFEWGGLRADGYQVVPVLSYSQFARRRSSKIVVRQRSFERQLDYLENHGYRVITIDNLLDFLEFKAQIPEKAVVITIDGGWKSTFDIAYPILKTHKFPATLFLRTDLIGKKKGLSWKQVREMQENGMDIQCGTNSHHDLLSLAANQSLQAYLKALGKALMEPKGVILKQLGQECRYLAYPHGKTNSLVISFLKKYGYRAAFTKTRASNPFFTDPYRIKRALIYGDYGLDDFKKNLVVFKSEDLL
jgi:peptidoglycan/xylan/chitin deacetylase (PgdA/CDA1 family)